MSKELSEIGALTLKEYELWLVRNKARNELKMFYKDYWRETGNFYDAEESELEDVIKFDALKKTAKEAQNALASARSKTRCAAKKMLPN